MLRATPIITDSTDALWFPRLELWHELSGGERRALAAGPAPRPPGPIYLVLLRASSQNWRSVSVGWVGASNARGNRRCRPPLGPGGGIWTAPRTAGIAHWPESGARSTTPYTKSSRRQVSTRSSFALPASTWKAMFDCDELRRSTPARDKIKDRRREAAHLRPGPGCVRSPVPCSNACQGLVGGG